MIKRLVAGVLALSASTTVMACTDTADLQARSLAQRKAYCAAQKKQFLWKDTAIDDQLLMPQVRVEGRCVGPGEHGYRAPEPPDDEP